MIVAHILLTARPGRRDALLGALAEAAPQVRARAGCALFAALADAEDPDRIAILHEWEEAGAFAAYAASPDFAALGRALGPDLAVPPESRRFEARRLEAATPPPA